ncbi:MAG: glycosyltransferase [Candidatus Latescibacteria bacterium]|nr:glycosyltransferase [Candidatus Latescibacterota bacterium]
MRKVLFIAYYYPPLGGAGVPRTLKFVKYLPKFGWQPIVLTPAKGASSIVWDAGDEVGDEDHVVRTGYHDVFGPVRRVLRMNRRAGNDPSKGGVDGTVKRPHFLGQGIQPWLTRFVNEYIAFPDARIGWYPFGVREGLRTIKTQGVSVIYSTSPPETSHLIAHRLKEKTGIPWVADFRDLWTYNPAYEKAKIKLFLDERLEKRTLRNVDAVVTVSEPWVNIVSMLHNLGGKNVYMITNGFDPEDYAMDCSPTGQKMIVTYTGVIYTPGRDPEMFLRVVSELIKTGQVAPDSIEVRFYGSDFTRIDDLRRHYGIEGSVKVFGNVPFKESIQAQLTSHVLLMLDWERPDARGASKGIVAGKIFEYLGARRPILSLSPHRGAVTELLEKTNAGVAVSNDGEIKETLLRWYDEFMKTGSIHFCGIESEILRHTREKKTKQLAEALETVYHSH